MPNAHIRRYSVILRFKVLSPDLSSVYANRPAQPVELLDAWYDLVEIIAIPAYSTVDIFSEGSKVAFRDIKEGRDTLTRPGTGFNAIAYGVLRLVHLVKISSLVL